MRCLLRLGIPFLTLATGGFITPASASLEINSGFTAMPQDEIAFTEYTGSVACVPVSPRYVPSFIRALDGTIIGVGYIEVESESRC
ncbi:hypothetical protein [Rhizobium sp. Root1220]|uniref:hypothetical protein n=1 Tax=Rhizobium sp. Root1220 TaxID=1736432 RepID=UPI0006F7C8F4|nr:hypothetical protein [Rhizobium sp. Root1220]KQV83997.1 hypothetical protein ASC90_00230 [Rhizobium sp. Root1220]